MVDHLILFYSSILLELFVLSHRVPSQSLSLCVPGPCYAISSLMQSAGAERVGTYCTIESIVEWLCRTLSRVMVMDLSAARARPAGDERDV